LEGQNNDSLARSTLANKIGNALLGLLVDTTTSKNTDNNQENSDLGNTLASERAGLNPNIEGMLRQILQLSGINEDPDVLYGGEVPAQIREQWQEMGMDPDSEDEMQQFLERNGVYLNLDDQQSYRDKLRNTDLNADKKQELEQFNQQQLQQRSPAAPKMGNG
jgi:hypothetical protein